FSLYSFIFFFNYTPTTYIYTLSLHDALPIFSGELELGFGLIYHQTQPFLKNVPIGTKHSPDGIVGSHLKNIQPRQEHSPKKIALDRKSTRLNSSHRTISYAVFCLKKKKKKNK